MAKVVWLKPGEELTKKNKTMPSTVWKRRFYVSVIINLTLIAYLLTTIL
jgi:hypothetical protein